MAAPVPRGRRFASSRRPAIAEARSAAALAAPWNQPPLSRTADRSTAPAPPRRAAAWLAAFLCLQAATAQAPAPGGSAGAAHWLREGSALLDREDPTSAWRVYRLAAATTGGRDVDCLIGLGRAHLMLGRSGFANDYADAALAAAPRSQEAMALSVRALIRARAFDQAVRRSAWFVQRADEPAADLLAAQASALFRVQRIDEAAAVYRAAIARDDGHAEAHLRLGSGLLAPREAAIGAELRDATAAIARGDLARAESLLRRSLAQQPLHPIAHRLLGEVLYAQRNQLSMAGTDPVFRALAAARPRPDVRNRPVAAFLPGYCDLSPERAAVVDRAVALFGRHLGRLVAVGPSHDLLRELERTTDADARSALRGKRTFDGRVWDDVRGVGGLQAATGIEALDEAAQFGFDTLAHELAHQVHFYGFTMAQRVRIKQLYERALRENRCLDYYAASNEAEYFGQGVEAFASFGKRPGGEATHGHTRFELYRVDRELHDFVASVVDFDPLRDPVLRERLLAAGVAVALRCGRAEDAVVAAELLRPGAERDRLLAEARAARAAGRCW